ncbi:MAG: hypothetical protein ACUZ8O_00485 [Candidatus Anammoxibacter sp.]
MKSKKKKKIVMKKKKTMMDKNIGSGSVEESGGLTVKYFFICIIIIEIAFIIYRFTLTSSLNGGAFVTTFIIVMAISFPLGLGASLNIFKNKDSSFLFPFGLCFGYGLVAGVWTLMILAGCPLNQYLYLAAIFVIAGSLLFRKRGELKYHFTQNPYNRNFAGLLSPIAVLLFAFIILSNIWLNSTVPSGVDCQSDSYNTLMIFKEGKYPTVFPFLDQTKLQLRSGPLFHTLIAVITKLKHGVLLPEIMAVTVISGSFFCMAIYFIARFLIKNEVILFFAGILTLTRAYLSLFRDGNLPENIALFYGALFIVLLMNTMLTKRVIFAIFAGLCLSFCALSHPEIFMYNIAAFSIFIFTLLILKTSNLKRDYVNLLVIITIILIMVIPYILQLGGIHSASKISQIMGSHESQTIKLHATDATTLIDSLPFWNGYIVLLLALAGFVLIAFKRQAVNVYLWTYFIVVLCFIEHWRFFQLFSPWFKLEPIDNPWLGANYSYKTFLWYPVNYRSAWWGGIIIWPIAIAAVIDFLCRLWNRYVNIKFLKTYICYFLIIPVFLFINYEVTNSSKYHPHMLSVDYKASEWLRKNTVYEETLIYVPFDNTKGVCVPKFKTSFWPPVVSERKSVIFRNYSSPTQFKFISDDRHMMQKKIDRLQQAAYTISNPESYKTFKDMGITHIFISSYIAANLLTTYQNSPFVELVHMELKMRNKKTASGALVYRVK